MAFAQTKTTAVDRDSSAYIETQDGVKLFAKSAGNGPVCIFVHGGPGAWSKSFEEMGGRGFEKRLKMVYLDQRGCGRSEVSTSGNYSLDRMVEDIEAIRHALGVERIYLLAHSFGGVIAVNYAKKYPDHLFGLILANSTLDLNSSLEDQIERVNQLIHSNFKLTARDSILTTFSLARRALSAKILGQKQKRLKCQFWSLQVKRIMLLG